MMDKNKGKQRKPSGPQKKPFTTLNMPASKQFETLYKLVIMRLNEEQSKYIRLSNQLLDKDKLTKEQFATILICQMLYIKKLLAANQITKERLKNEQFIENILNDEQLIKKLFSDEQLIVTLLNDEQLVEKVLNDEQLINKVFEVAFTPIWLNRSLISPSAIPKMTP